LKWRVRQKDRRAVLKGIAMSETSLLAPPGPAQALPQGDDAASQPFQPPAAGREKFIGFARDEASANVLYEVLSPSLPAQNQIHVVDFRASLAILAGMVTPEVILVDLSGEEQPINAMLELAEAVEAGTVVLAIGESHQVNFYRTMTKGMGVKEYLPKPLAPAAVARNFLPALGDGREHPKPARRGRMVAMTGTRGGVGTSTLAANLAWFIGTGLHRHTVLIDAELHTGTIGLNFNLPVKHGLGSVLEFPERVDPLLIERSTQAAGDRLHLLAGQEMLDKTIDYANGCAAPLLRGLQARYNFVVTDIGAKFGPFARDLLFMAQQRVVVMDPSMIALRNFERLRALDGGPAQAPRILRVLNKAGAPGGLAQSEMEQALGAPFDAVIPDLPRIVPKTTQLGTQAAALRGPFRSAIAQLAQALGATALAEAG
jgi:pilus assembly protein CpaE